MREPKYALVRWPDAHDPTVPSCIWLSDIAAAIERGAIVVAREDAELYQPDAFNPPRVVVEGEDGA